MSNQKISNQVLTGSKTAATAADSSQVALADLSAATVGAVGSQMTFAAPSTAGLPITKFSSGPSSNFHYGAFGYTGTFHGGTRIALVDWQGDGKLDEAFGIAPDRTIWHAWRNSGGWQQMPNNGRADNTDLAYKEVPDLNRVITVDVGSQTWGSKYSNGHWGSWVHV